MEHFLNNHPNFVAKYQIYQANSYDIILLKYSNAPKIDKTYTLASEILPKISDIVKALQFLTRESW